MYFLILKKIDEITKKGYRGRKKWRDKKKITINPHVAKYFKENYLSLVIFIFLI
jgi:hypothetical protein